MINATKAYSGKVAQNYDSDRITEPIWQTEQIFFKKYIGKLPQKSKLLDLPVGTGRFIPFYFQYGISFTGCDLSEDMLAVAKKKYHLDNEQLINANAEKLPFPDMSFEYAICCRLTHLISSKTLKKIIKEFSRVVSKELIVHFFTLKENHSDLKYSWKKNILNYFFNKISFSRLETEKTPWEHIQNYSHDKKQIEILFKESGWKIKSHHLLPDKQYKVNIYVLSKN